MELNVYFKSIIDQDREAVVICDLDHQIIYMNPAAEINYAKHGGKALLGGNLLACHNEHSRQLICRAIEWFSLSEHNNRVFTYHNARHNRDVYMIALRNENAELIGYYEQHITRTPETAESFDFLKNRKFL